MSAERYEPRDPHGRFRYGPWRGGPDPLAAPYDVRAAIDKIGSDVLSAGNVRDSLRELLREGRLAEVLQHDAFGTDPGGPVVRRKPAPRRTGKNAPTPEEKARAERRAALEAELAEAWKAARDAADARADAEDAAIVADRTTTEARRTVQRLAAELEQAEAAHEAAAAAGAEAAGGGAAEGVGAGLGAGFGPQMNRGSGR